MKTWLYTRKVVSHAIDYCMEHEILADFFSKNKAEVISMTIDMTYERRLELTAKEYRAQGIEEGIERGEQIQLINIVIKKVDKKKDINVIADELEEDVESIRTIYDVVVANPGKSAEEIYDIFPN